MKSDFCWKAICRKPPWLINCQGWGVGGRGREKKEKPHTNDLGNNSLILFLPWCKCGADPLMFAWFSAVYDEALASTLRMVLDAKVGITVQQFPQNTASIYCCRVQFQGHTSGSEVFLSTGREMVQPRRHWAVCRCHRAFSPVVSG